VTDVEVYTSGEAEAYPRDRLTPLLDLLPEAALEEAGDLAADFLTPAAMSSPARDRSGAASLMIGRG
jgi:hypothetical protein